MSVVRKVLQHLSMLPVVFVCAVLTLIPNSHAVEPDQVSEPAASAGQPPQPTFEIWEIQITGNTLVSREQLESALTPHLGPGKTVDDVQKAADAVEALYRDSGYPTVFVDIPEQNVTSGVVTLAITEGHVTRVRVSGARYFTPSSIRAQLKSVGENQALFVTGIQEDINRINSYAPDLRVIPVLKPGRYPGEVELEIKVDDQQPLHGSVDYSNYHTSSTTSTRVGASVGYYNLWQLGHSISLQTQVSPQESDEVRVFGATYLLPVGERDRIAAYVLKSESEIAAVSDINVIGNGVIGGMRYVIPLPSDARIVHSLSLGVDNKDFDESVEIVSADSLQTPIQYNVWSILYSSNFLRKHSTTNFGAEFAFGIAALGNSEEEFEAKRFNSSPNFSHLQLKYKRVDFLGDWQLHSKLQLHLTDSPLISNEQYAAGGVASVRGYYESEILGDNAVVWGVEGVTPMWLKPRDWLQDLRFVAFAEGAATEIRDALPEQENSFEIISYGLGLRAEFWKGWQLTLDSGYPLRDTSDVDKGDIMTHAQLSWNF